jgi:CzcA family heavy metal efflux pump
MLDRIILWSLRNRLVVLALGVLLIIFGIRAAQQSPLDVFPEFAPPQVVIQTEALGFSPEEVESLVTLPLEYALNGTSNLETMRSSSAAGLSVITCIFEPGTDIFRARQLVSERLQVARRRLPQEVGDPQMMPISSPVGIILKLTLTSDKSSLMDLRTLADWTIRPRLLGTPGVSQVVVIGGEVKQYQVLVDPVRLKDYNVTLSEVIMAAHLSNQNAGAGFMVTPGQIITIQGQGRVQKLDDVANAVVAVRNGVPVTIRQVADVQVGPEFKIGDASLSSTPCVYLTVLKQPWANSLTATQAVEEALKGLQSAIPPDVHLTVVFRQADFIETSIHNINTAILQGGALVILVLMLFLFSWRTGLISFTAIPLSLLAAIIVLRQLGGTINTMTLGGLAVAIGELVDDAIVDVENVFRRLRENRLKEHPEPALSVIYHASSEVRHSIIYATFIIALVFLPIFALSGLAGRIFAPLGIAYILSILASLVVALTVTPALCYFLLPGAAARSEESFTVRWLKRWYGRLLEPLIRHPWKIMAGSAVLLVAALVVVPFLGGEFLPEFNEGNLIIRMTALPGTSLEETMRLGRAAMQRLRQVPEVTTVAQRAGRAELDEDAFQTNSSEIDVELRPSHRRRDEVLADVRKQLDDIPGVTFNIKQFISERIEEVLAGTTGTIAVKVFGPDLPTLRQKAWEIQAAMAAVPGVVDLQIEPQVSVPKLLIRFNHEAMAQFGLRSGDLASLIETAFRGSVVSRVFEEQRTFALLVRFDPRAIGEPEPPSEPQAVSNVEMLRQTLIDTPTGGKVPLRNLADIKLVSGPNIINRENAERRIVVQANVSGASLTAVVEQMQQRIARQVRLPTGYYIVYGGQYEAQLAAKRQMLLLGGAAILGIFLLLFLAFRTAREVLLVMANLPLALIGGVAAVALTGRTVSVGSLVGFVAVLGIVMRNGIMLVTHYHHLIRYEGVPFGKGLVVRGAMERLSPILMTAMTAGLGLLPLAMSAGKPGRELEQPMAVVILGGLITSTLLNMVVIPALYLKFGRPVPAEGRIAPEVEPRRIAEEEISLRPQPVLESPNPKQLTKEEL